MGSQPEIMSMSARIPPNSVGTFGGGGFFCRLLILKEKGGMMTEKKKEIEKEKKGKIEPLKITGIDRNYAIGGWIVIQKAFKEIQDKINEIIAKVEG